MRNTSTLVNMQIVEHEINLSLVLKLITTITAHWQNTHSAFEYILQVVFTKHYRKDMTYLSFVT